MFIQPAYTCTDNRTDTRTAAAMSVDGDVTLTGKPAVIIALCHHDYVRIFRRNRNAEA